MWKHMLHMLRMCKTVFEQPHSRDKLTVWIDISGDNIIFGPIFFDNNANGLVYLDMINNDIVPELHQRYGTIPEWWVQDNASSDLGAWSSPAAIPKPCLWTRPQPSVPTKITRSHTSGFLPVGLSKNESVSGPSSKPARSEKQDCGRSAGSEDDPAGESSISRHEGES